MGHHLVSKAGPEVDRRRAPAQPGHGHTHTEFIQVEHIHKMRSCVSLLRAVIRVVCGGRMGVGVGGGGGCSVVMWVRVCATRACGRCVGVALMCAAL